MDGPEGYICKECIDDMTADEILEMLGEKSPDSIEGGKDMANENTQVCCSAAGQGECCKRSERHPC